MIHKKSYLPQKGGVLKRKLVHDLQTFLWQFEQGGYSRNAMREILEKFAPVLESDSLEIGGEIKEHLEKMMRDCTLYAKGERDSLPIVRDLDQLRRDLEEE